MIIIIPGFGVVPGAVLNNKYINEYLKCRVMAGL